MSPKKLIFSGFGGQGIITLGKITANIGMHHGKHVTHFPSYGAEMRGGTANCSVIISDEEIASPVFTHPTTAVVMNDPSTIKFSPMIEADGYLIMDTDLVKTRIHRKEIRIFGLPATSMANDLGDVRCANIILLGALIRITDSFDPEICEKTLKEYFQSKPDIIDLNVKAFRTGLTLADKQE